MKARNLQRVEGKVENNSGFSLIVTVTLLTLLLLLSLGLLGLSTSVIRGGSGEESKREARANARLALSLAIAKLQETAGLDQRVTAHAKLIYDSVDGSGYWTGIWSSERGEHVHPHQAALYGQRQLAWLVSGAAQLESAPPSLEARIESGNAVKLATGGAAGVPSQSVIVPVVDVSSSRGRYNSIAYWISDESQKANLSVVERTRAMPDQVVKEELLKTAQSSPPSLIQSTGGSSEEIFSKWKQGEARQWLATAPTFNSLDHVVAKSTGLAMGDLNLRDAMDGLLHDVTVDSRSLPVDVVDGGYKGDLSVAFSYGNGKFVSSVVPELSKRSEHVFGPVMSDFVGQIFPGVQADDSYDPGGPYWSQLHAHVNRRTSGSGGGVQFQKPMDNDPGFFPVMSRFQWSIKAFSVPVVDGEEILGSQTAPSDSQNLYGFIFPTVTLWNPYNVAMIVDQPIVIETDFNGFVAQADSQVVRIAGHPGAVSAQAFNVEFMSRGEGVFEAVGEDPLWHRNVIRFVIEPFQLEAGQALNFAAKKNTEIAPDGRNLLSPVGNGILAKGFYAKKELPGQRAIPSNAEWWAKVTIAGNSTFRTPNKRSLRTWGRFYPMVNFYVEGDGFSPAARYASFFAGRFRYNSGSGSAEPIRTVGLSDIPSPLGSGGDFVYAEGSRDRFKHDRPNLGSSGVMAFPGVPVEINQSNSVSFPLYQQANVRAVYAPAPPQEHNAVAQRAF
ncbi:MAG: hypothetical protein AAGC74_00025 [Verrucomicrobiota bacterium]